LQKSCLIPHKVKLIFFPAKILPIPAGRENIPENSTFPGENAAEEENVLGIATIPGEMAAAVGKHPGCAGNSGRKMHATENTCYKVQRVSYFFVFLHDFNQNTLKLCYLLPTAVLQKLIGAPLQLMVLSNQ
jgi:hypothetical protein